MIHKRINKAPDVTDDFTHLAEYIAAASEEGEKLDQFWIANCDAGTELADLDAATAEVEAIRARKPKVSNKTYHLVISFHPGEEERLDKAALQDIVNNYAEALGFSEHQYVAGSHINTDNMHIHVAFNRIHPQTLKAHAPFNDFKAMEKVARAMEKKYGLAVDRGMSDPKPENSLSPGARDFEANTWTESFQRHVLRHKDAVLAELKGCRTWPDVHAALARYDIRIKPHGAGMVLTSPDGQTMKASALHRSCAKAALERRFGAFQPALESAPFKEDAPEQTPTDSAPDDPFPAPYAEESMPTDDTGPVAPINDGQPPPNAPQEPTPENNQRQPPVSIVPEDNAPSVPADDGQGPSLHAPVVARYKPRPLVRRPMTSRLWRKYLQSRRGKRSTLFSRSARNWKMYLMTEAYRDPLAAVLIMAHQEALATFFDPGRAEPRKPPRLQPEITQALTAWRNTAMWSKAAQAGWVKSDKLASAGVRVDDKGNLVIPFRDASGRIQGVRMLAQTGETLDLGMLEGSAAHIIDPKKRLQSGTRVVIATDYHAALAIHRATTAPVVLAPSEHAVPSVITALERIHGPLKPVIAAQTPEVGAHITHARVLVPREAKRHTLRAVFAEALGDTAMTAWNATTGWAKAATNDWLKTKDVPGFGVRQRACGGVAVPLRTLGGHLQAVLEIDVDGAIRQKGRSAEGLPLVHIIDPMRRLKTPAPGPVVIASGYAEAAAIHRATRAPVIMAASPEEWAETARAVQEKWPNAPVVAALAPDVAASDVARVEELGVVVIPVAVTDHMASKHAEALRATFAEPLDDQVFLRWNAGKVPTKEDHDTQPWLRFGHTQAGGRLDDDANLLLPLRDSSLRLAGVMAVGDDRKVIYRVDDTPADSPPTGLFHVLGGWMDEKSKTPVIITDDLEVAAKLHRETKATVVYAADDLESVTRSLQKRFTQRHLYLVNAPKLAERLGIAPLLVGPIDVRDQVQLTLKQAKLPLRSSRQATMGQR
jgi:phage/plasmid primase-like uncharacterized protein